MWMLPLYLHVNKKSDDPDDDDDEQHHWFIVKMLNHNVLHNTVFLTSLQELNRYCLNNVSSSEHQIFDYCAGTGATSISPSR